MYGKTGPSKWRISIFNNAPGLYSDTVPLTERMFIQYKDLSHAVECTSSKNNIKQTYCKGSF